jgi:hypothetical protein
MTSWKSSSSSWTSHEIAQSSPIEIEFIATIVVFGEK